LSNDVVELFEKLFLAFLVILWILYQRERDIISGNPIKEKLLMLFKLRLRIAYLANNIPKSIRDYGNCMIFI
jgi:hypothetical protein